MPPKNQSKSITGELRDQQFNTRISKSELEFIDKLCAKRKAAGAKHCSRVDIIVLAVKFAMGELSLLDRMEMNLLEGKSLFDAANFRHDKSIRTGEAIDPKTL
jgi:hypothetical protein